MPLHATWVRFPRFVGDAVMQIPVLRLLRQMEIGPIVVWGPALTVSLLKDHPLADAVWEETGKPTPLEMARTLRRYQAQRSIHFPKSLRPALAAWLARVPERIGVSESLAGLFNTTTGPFWKSDQPFLLRYHAVLQKRWPDVPEMPFADYDPGLELPLPDKPYLCLMPGSVWPSKMWPAEHFKRVARLAQEAGLEVVVLGVPSEREVCDAVAGTEGLNLCGKTTLKEAAAWLKGARMAIGNDSGLSHLAAATGKPALALYGATDPGGSAPWGRHSHTLRLEGLPCAPCFKRVCPLKHECMKNLTPESVWEKAITILGSQPW